MKGAKGVIISITGGEDMRLMEVDEAANHIKDLVDEDANIIWGSAFNNDLQGKIRVSVVATGIDADAVHQAPPVPAKVFTFPTTARTPEPVAAEPELEVEETVAPVQAVSSFETVESSEDSEDELSLDDYVDSGEAGDELVLGQGMAEVEEHASFIDDVEEEPKTSSGTRPWLQEPAPAPKPAREGGTLFERMSNIARGAAKAQVDEDTPARADRDPLDIPRFLNRQNNQ